ncbi:Stk1 family PASTA domain-containing Ser/Thr kinase [Microbacterium esteraromaticum]|uniref:non-specific serine/threonine protein kinase n=1 Tax=Microbacterium esteraromaticum TaxID=57043 RepID=A0A7D8AIY6_9MICO|nr:Stk1 family PASTA domain-containing Ser/Thr kinase [Microbacterium esteraromaticum]QMU96786.1 Stk1 family PASTA domain-containing Ser/Thr kinase [Microbacterium esteraromaticum]
MSPEPRIIAGRYRVDEVIGQGGMAKVHRGYDLTLGREVAIKILDPELARDTAFRTRFRLEAQAASRMSHPSIVRVFDAGDPSLQPADTRSPSGAAPDAQAEPYIVMELVQGTLLKDIIARGPVPLADAIRYADGILEALEYSHRAGVVHRDIKPGNVMITERGTVKVMDFGIARAVSDSSSTVAETTQIIGTAAYFSPEQAKGEAVDARTDLYSAGVVLYEMLSGRQPFRGDSPVAVAYQHVSETPLPPTEVNEQLPRSLDAIVLRALAKDPYQRFPDAGSFRMALKGVSSGEAPSKKDIGALTSELYGPNPRQAQETARSLRQLSTDTTMTRTQSGPPVAWIWAGVALLAVLLISVLIWVVTLTMRPNDVPTTSVTVPNLVNLTSAEAESALEDKGLIPDMREESSVDFAEDHVIRSSPTTGAKLTEGTSVIVYVSTGADTIEMPVVEGLSQDAAKTVLDDAGLELGTVRPQNDKDAAAGTVLSASEAAGSQVAPGTVVDLVVANGQVTLEDMTGFSMDAAKSQLEKLGLTAEPIELGACTDGQTPNVVISMSKSPGEVPIHSAVELRYCVPPAG